MAINPKQLTGKSNINQKVVLQGPTIPTMSTSVKTVMPVQSLRQTQVLQITEMVLLLSQAQGEILF